MLAANEFQNARLDYNGYQIKMTKEYMIEIKREYF